MNYGKLHKMLKIIELKNKFIEDYGSYELKLYGVTLLTLPLRQWPCGSACGRVEITRGLLSRVDKDFGAWDLINSFLLFLIADIFFNQIVS